MTNQSNAQTEQSINTTESKQPTQAWQAFNWPTDKVKPSAKHVDFAACTLDIVGGVEVILQMMEFDEVALDFEEPKLLNNNQRSALMRLCITSLCELQCAASGVLHD